MANFKLICFVKRDTISEFFNKIKLKYNNDYSKFLKKFEKNYFKCKPYNELYWNYNSALINNLDNSIMFYTNSICESYNRTLNLRFVGSCKSILNFERCIKEVFERYENRNIYQERNISITRALQFYVNNKTDKIELIKNSDLKDIKKKYLNYLNISL